MTTPLSKIIKKLEKNHTKDSKNTANTLAVAADLLERQELMIETLAVLTDDSTETSQKLLPLDGKITKEYCLKQYGNYQNTYQAYHRTYGISCRKGWDNLLSLIENLQPPNTNGKLEKSLESIQKIKSSKQTQTTEERLERLERLTAIIMNHLGIIVDE